MVLDDAEKGNTKDEVSPGIGDARNKDETELTKVNEDETDKEIPFGCFGGHGDNSAWTNTHWWRINWQRMKGIRGKYF